MTGVVVNVLGRYYTVECGDERINCVLRGRIKKDKSLRKYSNPAATGDIVDFEITEGGEGVINSIEERRNLFSRKDKIKGKEDIIAANLDQIIIIQSFLDPLLNLRFVDRLLVRADKENIPVFLCVNKVDLVDEQAVEYIYSYYRGAALTVVIMSAETGEGVDRVKEIIENKLSIFVGYSGVGKTTLLNSLYPGLNMRTSEVSESTGKGKHTTTNVAMVSLDEKTRIIDTPGVREFGLVDIEPQFLGNYFNEFKEYIDECNFKPCTHDHEPKCEVKRQVEEGNICEDRYISYLQILYSLKEDYENMY
ncbi:MAG: ribosome small subunit-dependent GTPase A [bacterium]|nr:ribosome small subunit-dependent GTPase A [bacterium]